MDYWENICSLKWAIIKGYVKFSQFGRQLDIKVQIHAINSYIWGSKCMDYGKFNPKMHDFFIYFECFYSFIAYTSRLHGRVIKTRILPIIMSLCLLKFVG